MLCSIAGLPGSHRQVGCDSLGRLSISVGIRSLNAGSWLACWIEKLNCYTPLLSITGFYPPSHGIDMISNHFLIGLRASVCALALCALSLPASAQSAGAAALFGAGGGNPADSAAALKALRDAQAGGAGATALVDPDLTVAPAVQSAPRAAVGGSPAAVQSLLQQHVKRLTGLTVPRFGSDFFKSTGPRFDSLTLVGNSVEGYILGPGDEIRVQMTSAVAEFDERYVVGRDGQIFLPEVGPVGVAGIRADQLESHLRGYFSRLYAEFDLYATTGKLRPIEVYVVGFAASPGKLVVQAPATLVSAVFASGGPSALGSFRQVELIRESKVVATLDLYEFMINGRFREDVRLQHGDRVNFTPVDREVAFIGALATPMILELPADSKVAIKPSDLLGARGAFQQSQATLERLRPEDGQPLTLTTLRVQDLDTFRFAAGDVVRFLPISPRFDNAVTFRVLDAAPVRLPLQLGERVSSFLPNRVPILDRDFYTERYNSKAFDQQSTAEAASRSGVGGAGPNGALDAAVADDRELASRRGKQAERLGAYDRLRLSLEQFDIYWEQAIIERVNPATQRTELLSFNLRGALFGGAPDQDLQLQPGDIVTVLRASEFAGPASASRKVVRLEGEVRMPGIYQLRMGETLDQLIERAGGMTSEAYLYGLQLKRDSVLQDQRRMVADLARSYEVRALADMRAESSQFDLSSEAAIQARQLFFSQNLQLIKESSQRIAGLQPSGRVSFQLNPAIPVLPRLTLEDRDHIVIPKTPAHIQVAGSVVNKGVMLYKTKMTVRQALLAAGVLDSGDIKAVFIARADGSVNAPISEKSRELLAQRESFSWFAKEDYPILDTPLMPGDTVVVPEQPIAESGSSKFWRGLKDFTQVFSQLGLGIAALEVLRD